ncbi:hypothetical protein PCH_Pc22g02920 [Penicillium rubens Wisconsin 54-1255]|uniref:Uncharacterized protein n=1 Tax=Penicillium rubens (strain ATCC 28089 / DSM 1075 / NRRL 1951 / Wisconsin 54-1255) TaxID=500485 RepID=B6HPR9_PENRW|nr:hypothetical protein PCH_Pc22g02920 [Penicillium rubens Wisconsin 54-1255]
MRDQLISVEERNQGRVVRFEDRQRPPTRVPIESPKRPRFLLHSPYYITCLDQMPRWLLFSLRRYGLGPGGEADVDMPTVRIEDTTAYIVFRTDIANFPVTAAWTYTPAQLGLLPTNQLGPWCGDPALGIRSSRIELVSTISRNIK